MNNFTFGVIRSYRKCSSLFLLMASVVCLFVAGCATSNISVAVHDTTSTFDTVVVDAGHGGKDSGVFKGGIAEKVAALDVAQRLDKKLRAAGFHTVMTRNGDYFVELNERAAISLIPSKWREPFGRTCLEALAGGAAVVTSGTGGLREIGGDAALYVPDAEPARLAEALGALMSDASLRERLSHEGRTRTEALFDLPRVARRLDDACAAILARAK